MKFQYNSPVVLSFSLCSLIALLLGEYVDYDTISNLFSVYKTSSFELLSLVRMFTHVLGHASFDDLLSNMLMLLVIGPPLEEKYGSSTMFLGIVFTAFITGLIHILIFDSALLGASGIVFMMIILSSFSGNRDGYIPLTLIAVILLYLAGDIKELFSGSFSANLINHLAGAMCGLIVFLQHKRMKNRNS